MIATVVRPRSQRQLGRFLPPARPARPNSRARLQASPTGAASTASRLQRRGFGTPSRPVHHRDAGRPSPSLGRSARAVRSTIHGRTTPPPRLNGCSVVRVSASTADCSNNSPARAQDLLARSPDRPGGWADRGARSSNRDRSNARRSATDSDHPARERVTSDRVSRRYRAR